MVMSEIGDSGVCGRDPLWGCVAELSPEKGGNGQKGWETAFSGG